MTTSAPRAPDLLPIVREAAASLTPDELAGPMLVGVSGGSDSLALLHLLWRWSSAGGPAIRAVQVDHGLRPESAAEANWVADTCAAWGVAVALRRVDASAIAGQRGGLEEAARRERYRVFADEAARCGARVLAVGHQADDQAETMLLHLLRGAGLAGLAALPLVRRSGDLFDTLVLPAGAARPVVWRPLLAVRRAAIAAYCRAQGLTPLHDPSNDDTTLRRNALRQVIVPAIEQSFPGATAALARSAALLADDEAVLQGVTEEAWQRCAREEPGLVWLDRARFRAEARGVQRRLIRRVWQVASGATTITGLGAATVDAAREGVLAGQTGRRFALPAGVTLLLERAEAVCGRTADLEVSLRRRIALPQVPPGWSVACSPGAVAVGKGWRVEVQVSGRLDEQQSTAQEALHLPLGLTTDDSPVLLRTWQPGDCVTLGRGRGTQKLHDWFVNRHIPGYLRRHLLLLAQGQQVLWVAGLAAFVSGMAQEPSGSAGCDLRLLYNGTVVASTGLWPMNMMVGEDGDHGGGRGADAARIDREGTS